MKSKHVRMEVSFWRHKSKRAGLSTLYCRIHVAGKQKDICSTGITIKDEHWDGSKVSSDEPQAQGYNECLVIIHDRLLMIRNTMLRTGETITADKIKREFLKGNSPGITFAEAFDRYIKDCKADTDRALEESSVTVYDNVRKKMLDFLIDKKALDVLIDDFDHEWLLQYRRWMKTVRLKGGKVGHADSYIAKHSQTIRDMVRWAKRKKLTQVNQLDGLRIKQPEYGEPVMLSEEQFTDLLKHRFKNKVLQETADIFILLCRCGFHYGDLQDFVKEHRTALRQGLDGKPWLIKDRIKTQVSIRVPQFAAVEKIVKKYGGWEQLPIRPRGKFNGYLKLVAAELNLPDELSSKAGRKTFTDWCFNVLLLSTPSVLVLLGRKTAKGLEVYARPDERRVIAELAQSKALKPKRKG